MSKTAVAEPEQDQVETIDDAVGPAESSPATEKSRQTQADKGRPQRQPRYHVVLWDDNDHSYDYVIRMMQELFGHSIESGYKLAKEVDSAGRTICLTTTLEHAELKRDQIHAYGKDRLIARSKGSMSCTLEPER